MVGQGQDFKMPPSKIPSVRAREWRKGGVGGDSAIPLQKIGASPAALLIRAEQHKKVFFSFYLPAEASAQAGKKKSGARKSGKAKKTFLLGGECQRAAAGQPPLKKLEVLSGGPRRNRTADSSLQMRCFATKLWAH